MIFANFWTDWFCLSLECEGFARNPAKVEDQVRLLARAFLKCSDVSVQSSG